MMAQAVEHTHTHSGRTQTPTLLHSHSYTHTLHSTPLPPPCESGAELQHHHHNTATPFSTNSLTEVFPLCRAPCLSLRGTFLSVPRLQPRVCGTTTRDAVLAPALPRCSRHSAPTPPRHTSVRPTDTAKAVRVAALAVLA